jgi:hypothetical protein
VVDQSRSDIAVREGWIVYLDPMVAERVACGDDVTPGRSAAGSGPTERLSVRSASAGRS